MKKEIKGFENYTVNDCGDNERTIYNEIRCKYKKPQKLIFCEKYAKMLL